MSGCNLVIPLVIWGKQAPTHCVSSILLTPDQRYLVTGCHDGQICIWDVTPQWQIQPINMLFGHTSAITCLCIGSTQPEKPYVVSSSDNGEMCLWDLTDGRSIEYTKTSLIHSSVQSYQMIHCQEMRLVCNGYYPDIHILHSLTFEVLFTLSSRIQSDWMSALCVLRPVNRETDVVVAMSNSGTVKVWTLTSAEKKSKKPLYEDESKQVRCLNAQMLRCCAYNQRTMLVVCSKYWQIYATDWFVGENYYASAREIYDAEDFSLLCSESSRCGERWIGGDFIAVDKIVVWSYEGKAYLYKLPLNTNPESEHFRHPADPSRSKQSGPQAYITFDVFVDKALECSPAMIYFLGRRDQETRLVLRGDSAGRIAVWAVPEVKEAQMKLARQESFDTLPVVQPICSTTLSDHWANYQGEGIIDHLNKVGSRTLKVTASIYIASKSRLICGRDDGSIVIVPAIQSLILQLMEDVHTTETLPHQILNGHVGQVNCLLYPCSENSRFDPRHLVSGGVDFTVCLWDITTATKLHSFCVHGGEVLQLLLPPSNCNPRVQHCVCSVASDHSLALLSLKEKKSVMLASRHLFPIQTVKWLPMDDFVIVGCTDGTVYVWQMETGHLDRVVHGVTAEAILSACDAARPAADIASDLSNPTISLAQAFRRHNMATFRNLAQQHLRRGGEPGGVGDGGAACKSGGVQHPSLMHQPQAVAMTIGGLRANLRDSDSHVIYFDTETLIVQLLSEEYSLMSPNTLESLGFVTPVEDQSNMTEAQRKVADFFAKVKDHAEIVGQRLQTRGEAPNPQPQPPPPSQSSSSPRPPRPPPPRQLGTLPPAGTSVVMSIAQLLLSCLHAWGLDPDLDQLCTQRLGLMRPRSPLCFGLVSRTSHVSLLLPAWQRCQQVGGHWHISGAITTQHLMAVISVANTLMGMTSTAFNVHKPSVGRLLPDSQDRERRVANEESSENSQTKQGWSLLAALHCVMLPDLIGPKLYRPPQLEILARRWQDRCLEIREASQALMLAELRRIGAAGRQRIVDEWAPFLPSHIIPSLSLLSTDKNAAPAANTAANVPLTEHFEDEDDDDNDQILGGSESPMQRTSESYESRRQQATAIVMLGVLGAEFGAEMEPGRGKDEQRQRNLVEGFGLTNYSHARHTSKALTFLLLQPPSNRLPANTPIRRAAVDLLGRGFAVWEPYIDMSAVLLGLLELCVDGDKLVPSMTFGLPLCPAADSCRTARHALSLIATARPPAFVTTLAREVARHNALAQSAQTTQYHGNLAGAPLMRAKQEILRVIELLVDKMPSDIADLLVEVMDIVIHCVEQNDLKNKGLQEVFPAICKFATVTHCNNAKRVCVGAKNGGLAFYELKPGKCQILPAHKGPVSAVAYSPDTKYLASYSFHDNRLLFWQTASSSLFGIGSQQTKCVKSYDTPPLQPMPNTNPLKMVKLVWVDNRTVVLLTADGSESRYHT